MEEEKKYFTEEETRAINIYCEIKEYFDFLLKHADCEGFLNDDLIADLGFCVGVSCAGAPFGTIFKKFNTKFSKKVLEKYEKDLIKSMTRGIEELMKSFPKNLILEED